MAAVRFLWQNFAHLTNTILSVSSENSSFPKRWLLDPLKTMKWRSKTGWTVIAGVNDKIDVLGSGAGAATIVFGYYATGALYAVAVQAALQALWANAWSVTYDAATHKLRITGTSNFGFGFGTGANLATSASIDLGWTAADVSVTVNDLTAPRAVYQSRQYITFDLGSALEVRAVVLAGIQSLTLNGVIRVQLNAANAWTAPTYNQSAGGASQKDDIFSHWLLTPQTLRWIRIVIDDTAQPSGYQEVGLAYVGTYLEIGGIRPGFDNSPVPLSNVQVGDTGAIFSDNKGDADSLDALLPAVLRVEKDAMLSMHKTISARPLFFALDPTGFPTDVRYMSMLDAPSFQHQEAAVERYNASFKLTEQVQ